jgi:hypothetical protein
MKFDKITTEKVVLKNGFKKLQQDNGNKRIPVSHKYPMGIEPKSLMTKSKQVDHWTSGPLDQWNCV